jgi:biotin synthase
MPASRPPSNDPSIEGPEAETLLRAVDPGVPLEDVLRVANSLRVRHSDNRVELCAIVNAKSGACTEDCRFCSQSSKHLPDVPVFPLLGTRELREAAERASAAGALRFGIVTSGKALSGRDFASACRSIEALASASTLSLCASLGSLSAARARSLKSAGLIRYHHNVETSRRHFPALCTTHSWEQRAQTIRNASWAGLETCVGGIVGVGESWRDRAEMALEIRALGPSSVPLNFLIPIPGTPLQDAPALPPEEILRTIALFRMAMPELDIRIAAGRVHLGSQQERVFRAGANGIMIGDFLTRPGSDPREDLALLGKTGLVSELRP